MSFRKRVREEKRKVREWEAHEREDLALMLRIRIGEARARVRSRAPVAAASAPAARSPALTGVGSVGPHDQDWLRARVWAAQPLFYAAKHKRDLPAVYGEGAGEWGGYLGCSPGGSSPCGTDFSG